MEKFCEYCGDTFTSPAGNAKYCPVCRKIRRRETKLAYYHAKDANARRERVAERKAEDKGPYIQQGYMDLVFAITEQAFRDHDLLWLEEFGMEFLAFSGRPINQFKFDNLLEDMNGKA